MSTSSSIQLGHSPDVIVIGGGVIGLSIAWELAGHGLAVRVLEQGQFGQEASWAGAGMLPPGNPAWAGTPEAQLRAASHLLWPDWTAQLRDETGIDNGFRRCGGLEIRVGGSASDLDAEVANWRAEGVAVETPSRDELRARFPILHPDTSCGYFLPDLCQVRNPRHLKALAAACGSRGVELCPGMPVVGFNRTNNRIQSVRTPGNEHSAAEFVIASGAWSRELTRQAGQELNFVPVRGQIVLLEMRPLPFDCVVQLGTRYLVPRNDGRILVGSTEEHVGFDKRNTAEAVSELIQFACGLVPVLKDARFERCWAGLRPSLPGGLPMIGRLPGVANATIAAGHFRAGLQLSPITAVKVRRLIAPEGTTPPPIEGRVDACNDSILPTSESHSIEI